MKKQIKLFALMLAIAMLFGAVGCNKANTSSNSSEGEAGVLLGFDDETVDVNNGEGTGSGSSGGSGNSGGNGGQGNSGNSGNGGNGGNGGGTVVEKPVDVSGSDPFANIPSRLRGTTVIFAHFGDEGAAEYEKVLKAFTKKTGIKYKLVSFNQAEYVAQVSKQIAAKSGPDVIICNDTFPAALEIAQPLQNIVNLEDDFWDDNITNICTVGGNTYFVNSLESVWENIDTIVYNKTIFSNNGLTSPLDYYNNGKWTWENFKKCAEEVKKLGYVGGYADADQINASLGSPMINYDPKTAAFSASSASALSVGYQFEAQMFKDGLWSSSDWWGTFANGKIGLMAAGGVWGAKYNGAFKDADNNMLGMVPMPSSYKGKECKPTGSLRAYGIAKGAKNPEGAVYLLRYFLDYSYYSSAGANVFKNKNLEKMVFDHVIPEVKKKGINFDYAGGAFELSNSEAMSEISTDAGRADPAQVSGVLSGKQNLIDTAAQKANDKIASFR